jgi:hypothetical protein
VVYRLGASEANHSDAVLLPSYEEVSTDKTAFAAMTRTIHEEANPHNARRLVQYCGREAVVVNPPAWPLESEEIDRVYGLPFTRRPHPSYGKQRIPAFEVVKDSIQIMAVVWRRLLLDHVHEGRIVQSRSERRSWEVRHVGTTRLGHHKRPGRTDRQYVPDELPRPEARKVPAAELFVPTICPAGNGSSLIRLLEA